MFSRKRVSPLLRGSSSPTKVVVAAGLELGMTVRDQITSFTGVLTGKAEYLTGCRQYLVQPTSSGKPSEYPASVWIDEGRLVITDSTSSFQQPMEASNGPDRPAPKK